MIGPLAALVKEIPKKKDLEDEFAIDELTEVEKKLSQNQ